MGFDKINIFVDAVIVSLINNQLHILLGKRNKEPALGQFSLVGGHHKATLNSINSLKFHLDHKINLEANKIQKFDWADEPLQDPRGPSISLAHLVLVNESERNSIKLNPVEFSELKWVSVERLDYIQYGFPHHFKLIKTALERLESNVRYTKVGFELLQEEFTINDVINSFYSILGVKIDPSNLLKKLKALNIIEETNKKVKQTGKGKKALIYRLNKKAFKDLPKTTSFFKKG